MMSTPAVQLLTAGVGLRQQSHCDVLGYLIWSWSNNTSFEVAICGNETKMFGISPFVEENSSSSAQKKVITCDNIDCLAWAL